MTYNPAEIDDLERFTSDTSHGASIRTSDSPYPTAAERITLTIAGLKSGVSVISGRATEISIKAYVMTTVIILSAGAGLVYDRMMNPIYQPVSPSVAVLETAVALGGQAGGVALREMSQINERVENQESIYTSLPYSSDREADVVFNYLSERAPNLHHGPIGDALNAYGITFEEGYGWIPTQNSTEAAVSLPTPEDLATFIEDTAFTMGALPGDIHVLDAVGRTITEVLRMRDLCGYSTGCPPIVHPIETPEGQGMIAIYEGEARVFSSFGDGVHFLDNSGWTEAYDASEESAPEMKP